ncbi:MAG: nucleoside-triphosphatase [Tractidigestivibacter sp.]|jgi:nucleoside-triphosphatase THEP1|uniref:nucleoside-triphosphatase n=1 Tax=Tractidigestivibacter sp. TaxID=2847320 RepID=UPI003D92A4CE
MLFILTAPRQTGKTRWLEALVASLQAQGVTVYGVLAPGIWQLNPDGTRTKLGIENVLLPDGEKILFATSAANDTSIKDHVQSSRAGLGWAISDKALARVNAHLASLSSGKANKAQLEAPGLLVIDELGPLELKRGGGLTQGLALLDQGPTPAWPHAIAIVRPELTDLAAKRFHPAWGSPYLIEPGDAAFAYITGLYQS